jgi:hypothetical protein
MLLTGLGIPGKIEFRHLQEWPEMGGAHEAARKLLTSAHFASKLPSEPRIVVIWEDRPVRILETSFPN